MTAADQQSMCCQTEGSNISHYEDSKECRADKQLMANAVCYIVEKAELNLILDLYGFINDLEGDSDLEDLVIENKSCYTNNFAQAYIIEHAENDKRFFFVGLLIDSQEQVIYFFDVHGRELNYYASFCSEIELNYEDFEIRNVRCSHDTILSEETSSDGAFFIPALAVSTWGLDKLYNNEYIWYLWIQKILSHPEYIQKNGTDGIECLKRLKKEDMSYINLEKEQDIVREIIKEAVKEYKDITQLKTKISARYLNPLGKREECFIEEKYIKDCTAVFYDEVSEKITGEVEKITTDLSGFLDQFRNMKEIPDIFKDVKSYEVMLHCKELMTKYENKKFILDLKSHCLTSLLAASDSLNAEISFVNETKNVLRQFFVYLSSDKDTEGSKVKTFIDLYNTADPDQRHVKLIQFLQTTEISELKILKEKALCLEVEKPFHIIPKELQKLFESFSEPVRREIKRDSHGKMLIFEGSFIRLDEIKQSKEELSYESIYEIQIIASQLICVNTDLKFPGTNIVLVSPSIIVINEHYFNVSGINGKTDHETRAKDGTEPGDDGCAGEPGDSGQDGGNVYICAEEICNSQGLTIVSCGGDGGNGQVGGNGADGINGKDGKEMSQADLDKSFPDEASLSSFFIDRLVPGVAIVTDILDKYYCKMTVDGCTVIYSNYSDNFMTGFIAWFGYPKLQSYCIHYGGEGTRGLRGGMGGRGGKAGIGGNAGNIDINCNNHQISVNRHAGNAGKSGKDGIGGKGGFNGRRGFDTARVTPSQYRDARHYGPARLKLRYISSSNDINSAYCKYTSELCGSSRYAKIDVVSSERPERVRAHGYRMEKNEKQEVQKNEARQYRKSTLISKNMINEKYSHMLESNRKSEMKMVDLTTIRSEIAQVKAAELHRTDITYKLEAAHVDSGSQLHALPAHYISVRNRDGKQDPAQMLSFGDQIKDDLLILGVHLKDKPVVSEDNCSILVEEARIVRKHLQKDAIESPQFIASLIEYILQIKKKIRKKMPSKVVELVSRRQESLEETLYKELDLMYEIILMKYKFAVLMQMSEEVERSQLDLIANYGHTGKRRFLESVMKMRLIHSNFDTVDENLRLPDRKGVMRFSVGRKQEINLELLRLSDSVKRYERDAARAESQEAESQTEEDEIDQIDDNSHNGKEDGGTLSKTVKVEKETQESNDKGKKSIEKAASSDEKATKSNEKAERSDDKVETSSDNAVKFNDKAEQSVEKVAMSSEKAEQSDEKAVSSVKKAANSDEKAEQSDEKAASSDEKAEQSIEKSAISSEKEEQSDEKAAISGEKAEQSNEKAASSVKKAASSDEKAEQSEEITEKRDKETSYVDPTRMGVRRRFLDRFPKKPKSLNPVQKKRKIPLIDHIVNSKTEASFSEEQQHQFAETLSKLQNTDNKKAEVLINALRLKLFVDGIHLSAPLFDLLISEIAAQADTQTIKIFTWIVSTTHMSKWMAEYTVLQSLYTGRLEIEDEQKLRNSLYQIQDIKWIPAMWKYIFHDDFCKIPSCYSVLKMIEDAPYDDDLMYKLNNTDVAEWEVTLRDYFAYKNLLKLPVDWTDDSATEADVYLDELRKVHGEDVYSSIFEAFKCSGKIILNDLMLLLRNFYHDYWQPTASVLSIIKSRPSTEWEKALNEICQPNRDRSLTELISLMKDNTSNSFNLDKCDKSQATAKDEILSKELEDVRLVLENALADGKAVDTFGIEFVKNWGEDFDNTIAKLSDEEKKVYIDMVANWTNEIRKRVKGLKQIDRENFLHENLKEIFSHVEIGISLVTGFKVRQTQRLSTMLLVKSKSRGLLGQVATGEGKTIIIVAFCIMKNLIGENADVITSSSVLAKRDADDNKNVYAVFGTTVSDNCSDDDELRVEAYKKNVVYGEIGSFQRDILLQQCYNKNILGKRGFSNIVVDEVDSMLLDKAENVLYLSHDIADLEALEPVFVYIWTFVHGKGMVGTQEDIDQVHAAMMSAMYGSIQKKDLGKYLDLKDDEERLDKIWQHLIDNKIIDLKYRVIAVKDLKSNKLKLSLPEELTTDADVDIEGAILNYLKDIQRQGIQVKVPNFLEEFIDIHLLDWIQSAFTARFLQERQHYIIDINRSDMETGQSANVVIMDTDTGVEQFNMQWSEALHIFLQLKHCCRISMESLKAVFISNIEFFKLYQPSIYGLTGTLGSKQERDILQDMYNINYVTVPTFRQKQFLHVEDSVFDDTDEWIEKTVKNAVSIASKRPVLMICENIKELDMFDKYLKSLKHNELEVFVYKHSYEELDILKHNKKIEKGCIILATNLAGRGTDIKISAKISEEGGLHVILTYMPRNIRIAEQAFGRAARKGEKGSGQLSINGSQCDQEGTNPLLRIMLMAKNRNAEEQSRLNNLKKHYESFIKIEEIYFKKFQEVYKKLQASLKAKEQNDMERILEIAVLSAAGLILGIKILESKKEIILQACLDHWAFWLDSLNKRLASGIKDSESYWIDFKTKLEHDFDLSCVPKMTQSPSQIMKLGKVYMKGERFPEAMELFENLCEEESNFADSAHYYIAHCLVKTSNLNDDKDKQKFVFHLQKADEVLKRRTDVYSEMNSMVNSVKAFYSDDINNFIVCDSFERQKTDQINIMDTFRRTINDMLGQNIELQMLINVSQDAVLAKRVFKSEKVLQHSKLNNYDDLDLKQQESREKNVQDLCDRYELYAKEIKQKIDSSRERTRELKSGDFEGIIPSREEFWRILKEKKLLVEEKEFIVIDKEKLNSVSELPEKVSKRISELRSSKDFEDLFPIESIKSIKETKEERKEAKEAEDTEKETKEETKGRKETKEAKEEKKEANETKEETKEAKQTKEEKKEAKQTKEEKKEANETKEAKETKEEKKEEKETKEETKDAKETKEEKKEANETKEETKETKEEKKEANETKEEKKEANETKEEKKEANETTEETKEAKKEANETEIETKEKTKGAKETKVEKKEAKKEERDRMIPICMFPENIEDIITNKMIAIAKSDAKNIDPVIWETLECYDAVRANNIAFLNREEINSTHLGKFDGISKEAFLEIKGVDSHTAEEIYNIVEACLEDFKIPDMEKLDMKRHRRFETEVVNLLNKYYVYRTVLLKTEETGAIPYQELSSEPHKLIWQDLIDLKIILPVLVKAEVDEDMAQNIIDNEKDVLKSAYNSLCYFFDFKEKSQLASSIYEWKAGLYKFETIDSELKDIREIIDKKTLKNAAEELTLLTARGFDEVITLKEQKWSWSTIFKIIGIILIGIAQIALGVALEVFTLGGGTFIAGGLIGEGIGDIMFAIESAISGYCSMKEYLKHKVISIGITILTAGVGAFFARGAAFSRFGCKILRKESADIIGKGLIKKVGERRLRKEVAKRIGKKITEATAFGLATAGIDYAVEKLLRGKLKEICNSLLSIFRAIKSESKLKKLIQTLCEKLGPDRARAAVLEVGNKSMQSQLGKFNDKVIKVFSALSDGMDNAMKKLDKQSSSISNKRVKLLTKIGTTLSQCMKFAPYVNALLKLEETCRGFVFSLPGDLQAKIDSLDSQGGGHKYTENDAEEISTDLEEQLVVKMEDILSNELLKPFLQHHTNKCIAVLGHSVKKSYRAIETHIRSFKFDRSDKSDHQAVLRAKRKVKDPKLYAKMLREGETPMGIHEAQAICNETNQPLKIIMCDGEGRRSLPESFTPSSGQPHGPEVVLYLHVGKDGSVGHFSDSPNPKKGHVDEPSSGKNNCLLDAVAKKTGRKIDRNRVADIVEHDPVIRDSIQRGIHQHYIEIGGTGGAVETREEKQRITGKLDEIKRRYSSELRAKESKEGGKGRGRSKSDEGTRRKSRIRSPRGPFRYEEQSIQFVLSESDKKALRSDPQASGTRLTDGSVINSGNHEGFSIAKVPEWIHRDLVDHRMNRQRDFDFRGLEPFTWCESHVHVRFDIPHVVFDHEGMMQGHPVSVAKSEKFQPEHQRTKKSATNVHKIPERSILATSSPPEALRVCLEQHLDAIGSKADFEARLAANPNYFANCFTATGHNLSNPQHREEFFTGFERTRYKIAAVLEKVGGKKNEVVLEKNPANEQFVNKLKTQVQDAKNIEDIGDILKRREGSD